jgi:predicted CopG family antitoxin
MANYKSMRIEESVYRELEKHQQPRETFSDEVARILVAFDNTEGMLVAALKELRGVTERKGAKDDTG